MLELNEKNFENEVKKAKVLIIDFWADWCVDPNSTFILTDSNIMKRASNISVDDRLLTLNKKEIISDEVKKSFTSNILGHCKEIITETNRRIKVTDEHEFFTPKGWKKAIELNKEDKVAIMPVYTISDETFTHEEKTILKEEDILKAATNGMRIVNYIRELKDKDLLPFRINNKKLLIVSKLLGFLFSDGNLYSKKSNNYREVSFSLGTKKDVENLLYDLRRLGFNKFHIKKQKNTIKVNNRVYTISTTRVKVCSTSFWLLMYALGAPIGDKTKKNYSIPKWLMDTKYYYLKREFLAAYMGGDGPKIAMNLSKRKNKQPYNTLSLNDIEFHKNPQVLDGGLKLAKQISKLFSESDVKIENIFVENDNYTKKDGNKSKIIHIVFKKNFENALSLYQNVGYRYAYTKDTNSKYVSEFIRRILIKRKEWQMVYNNVIQLKEKKLNYKVISKKLGIAESTVWGWLNQRKKPTIGYHKIKYPSWLKENTKGLTEGLVWEPIKIIRDIYLESVQKITMKNNHNFIANGFLVHNCGPCKLMSPVIEGLSEEMKNVSFGKVNVDDNQKLAQKLRVMSIPTFLIFKNGVEVERLIGTQPRPMLKAKLDYLAKH